MFSELNKKRTFGLDLLRSIAIILVLISHGKSILIPVIGSHSKYLSIGGFFGVELFFVLSGFLIGGIIIRINEKNENLNIKYILNFWKRRWFRTLPNYYLILLLNILVAYIICNDFILSDLRYFSFFFFAQNFFTPHPSFFDEAWSLSVEEWFYIIFPLVLLFIQRTFSDVWTKKNKFIYTIILVFLFSLLLRFIIAIRFDPAWTPGIRKIVPLRLDSILTGVLFAWFNHYYGLTLNKYKYVLLLCSCLVLLHSGVHFYSSIIESQISLYSKTLYFNTTSLGFAFILPYANSLKSGVRSRFWVRVVTTISLISYSLYLVHYSFVLKFINIFTTVTDSIFKVVILYGLYFLISILVSMPLYRFFEKPMTSLRDRHFRYL